MNSHIVTDKHAIIRENHDVVKASLNATLDELYDFVEALRAFDGGDPSIKSLEELAKTYEALRTAFLEDDLNSAKINSIEVVLQHRLNVLRNKAEGIRQATEALNQLINSLS